MKPLVDKLNKLYEDGKYTFIYLLFRVRYIILFINSVVEVNTPTGKIQVRSLHGINVLS